MAKALTLTLTLYMIPVANLDISMISKQLVIYFNEYTTGYHQKEKVDHPHFTHFW